MRGQNSSARGLIAVAAAYALLLQTLVYAFGWCPQESLAPGSGVICSAHSGVASGPGQPTAPDTSCPCCSMICCNGVALAPPNLDVNIALPVVWTRIALRSPSNWRAPSESTARLSPLGARAPPEMA